MRLSRTYLRSNLSQAIRFPVSEGVESEQLEFHPDDVDKEEEFTLGEMRLSLDLTLKQLREACEKCGIATGGGRAKCLARLKLHKTTMEQQLTQEIAAKMFQECPEDAR